MEIFRTRNLLDGKVYIGKSEFSRHWYLGSGTLIQRSVRKYGRENFTKDILDTATSLEELNSKERYWIAIYRSYAPVYNILGGGEGWSSAERKLQWDSYTPEQRKARIKKSTDGMTPEKMKALLKRVQHSRHHLQKMKFSFSCDLCNQELENLNDFDKIAHFTVKVPNFIKRKLKQEQIYSL